MSFLDTLERLESSLQTLIEGSAARLFPDNNIEDELPHMLVEALQAGTKQNSEGRWIAPNMFVIAVHPRQAARLKEQEQLLDELARSLQSGANEGGLIFFSPPVIRITEDREVPLYQLRVNAQINLDKLSRTTDILVEAGNGGKNLPANAYLIIDGTRIYSMTSSVMNIGRRPDNQIVIDDPRVSRVHAQVRAINGRFVIFDLESRGGTFVNAQRVSQSPLFPGDVITLAGFPMVYGQDAQVSGETQKYTPEGIL
ncbi:MAG: FhaA domain-containing protein [Anaerolineales bacterium]